MRVVGIPDLTGLSKDCRAETLPVFRYLKGKEERIDYFDEHGLAWLQFSIPHGKHRGMHGVAIEPYLLQRRLDGARRRRGA